MNTQDPVRPFLFHALALLPLAVLAFLISSAFFSSWNGLAVGLMPIAPEAEPAHREVIVEGDAGEVWYPRFPVAEVEALRLPVRASGVPPLDPPEGARRTSKERFSLFFTLEQTEGPSKVVPTTSPGALAAGLIVWLLALVLRNMYVSGSPISIVPASEIRIEQQAAAGQVAPAPKAKRRGKQGPPPNQRKGKSKGRRR